MPVKKFTTTKSLQYYKENIPEYLETIQNLEKDIKRLKKEQSQSRWIQPLKERLEHLQTFAEHLVSVPPSSQKPDQTRVTQSFATTREIQPVVWKKGKPVIKDELLLPPINQKQKFKTIKNIKNNPFFEDQTFSEALKNSLENMLERMDNPLQFEIDLKKNPKDILPMSGNMNYNWQEQIISRMADAYVEKKFKDLRQHLKNEKKVEMFQTFKKILDNEDLKQTKERPNMTQRETLSYNRGHKINAILNKNTTFPNPGDRGIFGAAGKVMSDMLGRGMKNKKGAGLKRL